MTEAQEKVMELLIQQHLEDVAQQQANERKLLELQAYIEQTKAEVDGKVQDALERYFAGNRVNVALRIYDHASPDEKRQIRAAILSQTTEAFN